MKVTGNEFKPITIVLETEHEARALMTILDISEHLPYESQDLARDEIEEVSEQMFELLMSNCLEPYGA